MAIVWTSQYSISRAKVGKIGELVVAWGPQKTSPGYEVSAFGVKLQVNSPEEADGKRRAVLLARKLLADAQAALADAE